MEAKYITYISPKVLSQKDRKIKQKASRETTIQPGNELNSYGTSSSLTNRMEGEVVGLELIKKKNLKIESH